MALYVYPNTDNGLNPFYSFHVSVIESTEGYAFKSMNKRAPCLHTVLEVNTKKTGLLFGKTVDEKSVHMWFIFLLVHLCSE